MRYYCKNCKGTIILGEGTTHIKDVQFACCICTAGILVPSPDYETPEQYEKRTGKVLPDDGLVRVKDGDADEEGWRADYFWNALDDQRMFIVCVNGPLPPPDGWRPS